MNVSVVIVNYNVRDLLIDAVASVQLSMAGIDGEIIVVDNASTDGAVEALNEKFPDVITVPLDKNLGFGAANNIGIEMSRGEYILLLNPDTIVEEKTIRTMIDFMREHDDAAFASCKVILADGRFDAAAKRGFPSPWSSFCRVFGLSRLFPKSKLFGGYNLTYLDPDEPAAVEAICGCFMFCRADRLKALGGFDTDFFMYGEDLDLCYRARKEGWEIYYYPDTTIVHLKGESTRRSSIDALAVFYEAMEIFARKHFRGNDLLLLMVRSGIWVRRLLARIDERLPSWPFAIVDSLLVLCGFIVGSIIKNGGPFNYPAWAMPTVFIVPIVVFVCTLAGSGAYRDDDNSPRNALYGYLLGFFVLSTLTYFFKEYAFGRSIVLATTLVAAPVGVSVRFLWLLYRRTFGAEAIRRVAFLGRQGIDAEIRHATRHLFFGKPISFVGMIAPTFSELDRMPGTPLGSVENIAKIVAANRLTDIVVFDSTLSYGEVLRAITLTGSRSVRFRFASGVLANGAIEPMRGAVLTKGGGARLSKRLRERFIAFCILLLLAPIVYLLSARPASTFRRLWEVVVGRRLLVGSGAHREATRPSAMFTVAELVHDDELSQRELEQIEQYYRANQSFLLDCEIIIGAVRQRTAKRTPARGDVAGTVRGSAN